MFNLSIALRKEDDDEEREREEMKHVETMSLLQRMLEKLNDIDKGTSTSHPGGT